MINAPDPTPGHRYLTVRQLSEAYPAFSIGSIRWLLFTRTENGLDAAVLRIGRRLLVSERDWIAWIEKQRPWVPPTESTGASRARRSPKVRR